jgi:hypothetical protein
MLLFLMFVLAIILSFAVCVYMLLQQQSPPPKAKGGHNSAPSTTRSGGLFPLRRRQPIGIAKSPHDTCNGSNRRFGL